MTHETQATVELQRSVRYGRLLIGGAVVGAAIASLGSLFFPVEEGALYSIGQIMGFMLLIGGAIGLALGGVLALILNLSAKRQRGTAVVAIAHESEPVADQPAAAVDANSPGEAAPSQPHRTTETGENLGA